MTNTDTKTFVRSDLRLIILRLPKICLTAVISIISYFLSQFDSKCNGRVVHWTPFWYLASSPLFKIEGTEELVTCITFFRRHIYSFRATSRHVAPKWLSY